MIEETAVRVEISAARFASQSIFDILRLTVQAMSLSLIHIFRDVGSARVGKVYARQFLPAISRPEYMALRIMETLPETELPQFLSYFSY